MACKGEVGPRPDAVIFADVGDEAPTTMRHLSWLEGEIARQTNGQMATHRVTGRGRLSDEFTKRNDPDCKDFASAPFFMSSGGRAQRQCTRHFKIDPMRRLQRSLLGYRPRQRIPAASVEVWIGISVAEVVRAGASWDEWSSNRYPLLELGMRRSDCKAWLVASGYEVPPKSACTFCPYRTDAEWRWLQQNDPEAWAEALHIDDLVRSSPRMKSRSYLHRSLKPLAEVDLSTAEERGQGNMLMVCEAGCGL